MSIHILANSNTEHSNICAKKYSCIFCLPAIISIPILPVFQYEGSIINLSVIKKVMVTGSIVTISAVHYKHCVMMTKPPQILRYATNCFEYVLYTLLTAN